MTSYDVCISAYFFCNKIDKLVYCLINATGHSESTTLCAVQIITEHIILMTLHSVTSSRFEIPDQSYTSLLFN